MNVREVRKNRGIVVVTNDRLRELLGLSDEHMVADARYVFKEDVLEVVVYGPRMPRAHEGEQMLRLPLHVKEPAVTEIV